MNHDEKQNIGENQEKSHSEIQESETKTEDDLEEVIESSLIETTKKLESEISTLKDLILREKAENQNLRRRHEKELEESHKYAITSFARDLIEVQEDMQRALDNLPKEGLENNAVIKNMFEGLELIKNSLSKVFDKYGIIRIYPLDQNFDHNFHQAIVQVPTSDKPQGTVMQVIQAGYVIKDRLLRPALVAVAKPNEE